MVLLVKLVLCLIALVTCSLAAGAQHTPVDYYVGEWTTGRNYTAWAQGKVFYLGDTLTFTVNGTDAVIPVSKDAYDSCKWTVPTIPSVSLKWNFTIAPLLGDNYYISQIEDHCNSGMKLEVQVVRPSDVYQPKNYTVGGEQGWTTGVNYSSWASGKKFYFGDVLKFVFNASQHSLVVVPEEGYQYCNASFFPVPGLVGRTSDGNTVVTVVPPVGDSYYASQVDNDCTKGLKLHIEVLSTDQAPTSSAVSPSASPHASPAVSPSPGGLLQSAGYPATFTSLVVLLFALAMVM